MEVQVNNNRREKGFLSEDDKKYILSISDRHTALEISKMYNCSRSTILKLWMDEKYNKNGLSYKYYVDHNYFEEINTPNKAYMIGFIASDGNIYKRKNGNYQYQLQISLQQRDYKFLQDILKDMKSTNPVKFLTTNGHDYAVITIVSNKICEDLINLGLMENKTWNLNIETILNNIPVCFHRDFFRGYFDGDGFFAISKKELPSYMYIGYVMPLKNAELIYEYFKNIGIECSVKEDKRKYSHPFGRVDFFGYNKYIFLKYIYDIDDKDLRLERKYERGLKYFQLIENNISNRSENDLAIYKYEEFMINYMYDIYSIRNGGFGSTSK